MTEEQFEKFLSMMQAQMQAQTAAMQSQADSLAKIATAISGADGTGNLSTEVKRLRNVVALDAALSLSRSRSTENTPLQENGGLAGAIKDIENFSETGKTPENWKDYVTNEIYVKTFSGKPLKMEEI